MTTFVPLADAELFVRNWLAAQFPTARVVTELPANLEQVLPVIQVTRFGGVDDTLVLDHPSIDIDTYAATRTATRDLNGQVRSALRLHFPGYAAGGAAVQSVTTISGVRVFDSYPNPNLRRANSAYRITIHSIPS